MPTKIGKPIFRNRSKLRSDDGFDNLLYLDPWELQVQKKNSLAWNIVLAILKPLVHIELKEFQMLVNAFDIQKEYAVENIKRCIAGYNPFVNNSSCFYNKSLQKLVESFKKKVHRYIREKKTFLGNFSPFIDAACEILQCNIAVICEEHAENPTTVLQDPQFRFALYLHFPFVTDNYGITLYCKIKETNHRYRHYSFGLSENLGTELQKRSFWVILRPTKLVTEEEEAANLYKLPGVTENFIISLMKSSSHRQFVISLYKQLPHILWQLANAGFVTDPAVREIYNGIKKSAFYYALLSSDDPEILYLFYKHSTTTTEWRRSPPEALDIDIINNMSNLSEVLRETKKYLQEIENIPCERLILLEELIHINDYLLSICQKMRDILLRNDSDANINKAINQRDIVRAILDSYADKFNVGVFENMENSIFEFEHYKTFVNYFKNLDFTSAVLFFDKNFSMKKLLRLDDWYENFESSFIRFIYTCKWYQNDAILYSINIQQQLGQTSSSAKQSDITSKQKSSLWGSWFYKDSSSEVSSENRKDILQLLAYYSRISFQPDLDAFRNNIRSVDIHEGLLRNLKDYNQTLILIYNLKTEGLIKDELFLFELNHYLMLAISIDLTENTENGVLIILRALQVLGESMHSDVKDMPTVAKSLLVSLFSDKFANTFVGVRNSLCHHKVNCLYHRLQVENKKEIFGEVQVELSNLRPYLNHIFALHLLRIRAFISKNALNIFEQHIDCKEADLDGGVCQEVGEVAESCKEREKNTKIFQHIDFKSILKNNILEMEGNFTNLKKFLAIHLKNHLRWIEVNVMSIGEITTSKLKYRFLSIEKLLSLLKDEGKNEKHIEERILNILFDLKSWLSGLETKENGEDALPQIMSLLEKIKNVMTEIFPIRFKPFPDPQIDHITMLLNELDTPEPFPPKKMDYILSHVKDNYKGHHFALTRIIDSLVLYSQLSPEKKKEQKERVLAQEKKNLILTTKYTKNLRLHYENDDIKSLKEEIPDKYCTLKNFLNNNTFDKFKYEKIREEELCSVEAFKVLYMFLNFRYGELDFFRDRVMKLKKLVIKSDADIYTLWKRAEGLKTKKYLEDRIVSMYMQNSKLRAAVEMLLSDCFNLFNEHTRIKEEEEVQQDELHQKENTQLQHLLLKTERLCSGMNLRNMLAHGNPLAETVMSLLDPGDLPHMMAEKLIEFVSDLYVIHSFCQLRDDIWEREHKYLDYELFLDYCSSPKEMHRKMIMKIKKCRRWKFYAKLFP